MPGPLLNDTELKFPDVTVITASAGSGKTHTLTMRYVSFLLSEKIQYNSLRNILAITFTNNAAVEMKQRILDYLKLTAMGNKKRLADIKELVSMDDRQLMEKAGSVVDSIFDNYSDFQVRTIDSFMASVFKSSAVEFGYNADYEISLDNSELIEFAFEQFFRELQPHSVNTRVIENAIALLTDARGANTSFIWNPYRKISGEVRKLYGLLGSLVKAPVLDDQNEKLKTLKQELIREAAEIEQQAAASGLKTNANAMKFLAKVKSGNIEGVLTVNNLSLPFNKPGKKEEALYRQMEASLQPRCDRVNAMVGEYVDIKSRMYFLPYLESIRILQPSIEKSKKHFGRILIEDVSKKLADYLQADIIPEVYFKLGERIYHFLIDEFQDTSPIQWENIRHLVENSVASYGSLFVVGDTKQAIYGFRGADWTIMAEMTRTNVFPSASYHVLSLQNNYRSFEKIVTFNEEVFQKIVPLTEYAEAANRSGLTGYHQQALKKNRGKGIVEVHRFQKNEETLPEKIKLLEILKELQGRGYRQGEIAILTPANTKVIEIGGWLNEEKIEFISHSSLDIRRRKIAGELIALLRFLDSPIDDISFVTFITGDIFARLHLPEIPDDSNELKNLFHLHIISDDRREPYYQVFKKAYPVIWDEYFEQLFNLIGYLPLYDLISAVYKTFRVFDVCSEEEASLVKFLEVIKNFENGGKNNVKDFLSFAEEENEAGDWKIEVPDNLDAVRLMTIHKAKGLQFRVVIILLYDKRQGANDYYIADEPGGIAVLHINKEMAEKGGELERIYAERKLKNQVNDLNALYVAFTRAQEEMYVIGVYDKEPKIPTSFLPEESPSATAKPMIVKKETASQSLVHHHHHTIIRESALLAPSSLALNEIQRGELYHLVLSKVTLYEGDGQLDAILRQLYSMSEPSIPESELRRTVSEFLAVPEVAEYFRPATERNILIEQDVVDGSGRLYRIDRLVIDHDRVTVLDFKTGSAEKMESYQKQMRNYLNLVREIYPSKPVQGILAFIDMKRTTVVA